MGQSMIVFIPLELNFLEENRFVNDLSLTYLSTKYSSDMSYSFIICFSQNCYF